MNKFENSVLNSWIDTKTWFKKALMRAIKTAAQVFLSLLILIVLGEITWKATGLVVLVSAILSLIFSVVGIPEVTVDTPPDSEDINTMMDMATDLLTSVIRVASELNDKEEADEDDDWDDDDEEDDSEEDSEIDPEDGEEEEDEE